MPSRIRVLDEHTINQIAAGEVIENPASVVKELVENSLDAGSTDISIEIKGGGRQLIRITDDGWGMNEDDAVLCLERHATSKIRALDDLNQILSMGFRGEAIPSIASISKFMLLSNDQDTSEGTMVIVDGGKILKSTPAARSKGTTIEVKSLFFNVPVRKKFQKSPAYDENEIHKVVSLLALGNPEIKFTLIINQKTVLQTLKNEALEQRIEAVMGFDFSGSLHAIEASSSKFQIQGFVGNPSSHRHNRTGQFLFINKRPVVSPYIAYAVKEAYATMLPAQRFPIFVLNLTLPGSTVDVNVHPQKREVRLRQEQIIKELIKEAVYKAFKVEPPPEVAVSEPPKFFFTEAPIIPIITEAPPTPKPQVQPELFTAPPKPRVNVLATVPGYIICEGDPGLKLIDQKAAHSRILFEKFCKALEGTQTIEIQSLLIPYTLELTPTATSTLKQHLNSLNKMGFQIREFGPHTFFVDAVPHLLGEISFEAFLKNLLDDIQELGDVRGIKREQEKQLAIAASHSSISSTKRLSNYEAQQLINQLMECEQPLQSPLGQRTTAILAPEDLTRQFQRG